MTSATTSEVVAPGLLEHDARICLRSDVQFDGLVASNVIETSDAEYVVSGLPEASFTRILTLLDGRRTVSEIADRADLDVQAIENLCRQLIRHDLAVDLKDASPTLVDANEFAAVCNRVFPLWKARVFSHPLWQSLASGELSRQQFAGWLLETYHFIETVNSRLALAISECGEHEARSRFIHHYTEEWDHHHFFMTSLQRFGFEESFIRESRPLPGTLAVVNCMRDAARHDPLYYAACSGFLESTGDDRAAGRQFFQMVIAKYCPDNPGVIEPMRAHLDLDEEYGHNGVLEDIGPHLGPLTSHRVAGALQAVRQLVETLDLWSTDIVRHYADADALRRRRIRRYRPVAGGAPTLHLRRDGGAT